MSRRREPPPLIPAEPFGAGKLIGRRGFVRTAGGILVAASGLVAGCTDKLVATTQGPPPPPGDPDPGTSTVTASPSSIGVAGTSTLTLRAKDATGTSLTTGGATVVFAASGGTSTGTISATVDHGDGTYTATFTGTGSGTATTIDATLNGAAVTSSRPTVTVTAASQVPDPSRCTVTASPASIGIGAAATLTLRAKTSSGANLATGGAAVTFGSSGGTSAGTVSAVTDNGDGTYTATFTGTASGTATTISATINGAPVTTTMPTITVTGSAAAPDATKCVVTAAPATIGIGSTATLTLQAKDATGATITVGGAAVAFSSSGGTSTGTISAVIDHNNGTYTATFTGSTAGTATTIGATINGAAVTTSLPTITVAAGFQAPNVINNYGFESGFGPFNNGGNGNPDAVIDAVVFYEGSHSIKYAFAPSGQDTGASMYTEYSGSFDRLWVRVYMRLTNTITTQWKFIRFYSQGIATNLGGIFLGTGSGNGLVCVGWDQEDSNIVTTIGLTQAQVADSNWHTLEIDYQRNGGASGYPEAAFWWDGNPQYAELNGHSTVQYAGQNKSTWVNGRINAGQRSSSAKMAATEWMGTLNAGNGTSGQCNMDRIGVSSLGRIGP